MLQYNRCKEMHWTICRQPFPHFQFQESLSPETYRQFLSILQNANSWQRARKDLYELDVLGDIPNYRAAFNTPDLRRLLRAARKLVQQQFDVTLEHRATLHIHRFNSGHGTALHSDASLPGARLVIFIAPDQEPNEGGDFLLVDRPSKIGSLLEPVNNAAVLFLTNADWLHGVTEKGVGTRYSLVFQFSQALTT